MRKNFDLILGIILILLVTLSRNAGLPPNVSILAGISLFSGFLFRGGPMGYALPLVGLLLSDVFLGFYPGMEWVYAGFAVSVYLGTRIKKLQPLTVLGASLCSSLIFFVISNLGVWVSGGLYPHTGVGFIDCFVKALPFFRNSLLSDLLSTCVIFGSYAAVCHSFIAIKKSI